ncbi:acetate--CoA ligase family protein [Micromonospora zhanjiangensis]|uniref:Acetate--CoA ligase family protein n=1 Tax=Micromonospora zhanjiangensis TaxID=1522057 RepID=A0ABV8KVV0_9ACTN
MFDLPEPTVLALGRAAGPGIELVAGVVHDLLFGSLVTLGLGGMHTGLSSDRALRLLPVTDRDAAAMGACRARPHCRIGKRIRIWPN